MIRPAILKFIALAGLIGLSALIFGRAPKPVEAATPQTDIPIKLVSAKYELPWTERGRETARLPQNQAAPCPISFRDAMAALLADLAAETNDLSFEFQAGRMQAFIETIPTNDFALAFRELTELQAAQATATGQELQLRLLQRWSESDIHAAVRGLDTVRAEDQAEAYARVAAVWAKQNLAESVAWAQQLPAGSGRQEALLNIAYEAAFTNPKEALILASQVTVPPEKSDLFSQAAAAWATAAPETAASWASQIPDQPLREQVLAAIATTWADKDPFAAAQLVLHSLSAGPAQENAIMGIVQRLTLKDGESARVWVAQFPAGPLRTTALAEMERISERQQRVAAAKQ